MIEGNGPDQAARALELLCSVERVDDHTFVAANPGFAPQDRLFGGQVVAQALVAAGRTVPDDRRAHSLHCYFLRPGNHHLETRHVVETVRDGRTTSVRRVGAWQGTKEIFTALCSFHVGEAGDHQVTPAPIPGTGPLESAESTFAHAMLDLREAWAIDGDARPGPPLRWAKAAATLPDDPLLHAAVIVYVTDIGWAFEGRLPPGGPSIDHSVWLHRPARADQWLLTSLTPVTVTSGRGVYFGHVWDGSGAAVATFAQETLIRPIAGTGGTLPDPAGAPPGGAQG